MAKLSTHTVLKKFFLLKQEKNPAYSIRAFARDIGVSHSFISRLLNGERQLSQSRLDMVCDCLAIDGVGRAQLEKILSMSEMSREQIERAERFESSLDCVEVTEEKALQIFEEWYYAAVLTLVSCEDFKDEPEWVSQRLNISMAEAKKAWAKLLDLGMLKKNEDGKWQRREMHQRYVSKKSTWQKRRFHSQHLRKANETLQEPPVDEEEFELRLFNGVTVATDKESIRKVRSLFSQSMIEMARILSEGKPEEVYQLSIQMNPLTK